MRKLVIIICLMSNFIFYAKDFQFGNTKIKIIDGDLLMQSVDALVNAANVTLIGSAGVAQLIQEAAGPMLINYIRTKIPKKNGIRCQVGKAIVTPSFKLQQQGVKAIIHAVGPDMRKDLQRKNRKELLKNAYTHSLTLAEKLKLKSIAFPPLSTGIFGYPIAQAAPIAIDTIINYIIDHPNAFDEIRLICYNAPEAVIVYEKSLQEKVEKLISLKKHNQKVMKK